MIPISTQQVAQIYCDGFIIVEQLITAEQVALLRARFERLFHGEFESGLVPDEVNWQAGRDSELLTRQICNGWKGDRWVASVALHPRLGEACARLGKWPGARISQDNVLWKPPGGKPLGFHQDSSYEQWTEPSERVTCWIALDDTSAEGGTIEYVRGSHRWPRSPMIDQFHAPEEPAREMLAAAQRAGAAVDRVAVEVPAGGGAFHLSNTWHGSDINRSDRPRRAMVSHCMSSQARFKSGEMSYIYSRYKRCGDLSMDENYFPILWREDGYRSPYLDDYCARQLSWGEF